MRRNIIYLIFYIYIYVVLLLQLFLYVFFFGSFGFSLFFLLCLVASIFFFFLFLRYLDLFKIMIKLILNLYNCHIKSKILISPWDHDYNFSIANLQPTITVQSKKSCYQAKGLTIENVKLDTDHKINPASWFDNSIQ